MTSSKIFISTWQLLFSSGRQERHRNKRTILRKRISIFLNLHSKQNSLKTGILEIGDIDTEIPHSFPHPPVSSANRHCCCNECYSYETTRHMVSFCILIKRFVQHLQGHMDAWCILFSKSLTVLVATIDAVGGDGGCRVGKVRASTTSPMPDHKGFRLQYLVNFQKFSTLRVKAPTRDLQINISHLQTSSIHRVHAKFEAYKSWDGKYSRDVCRRSRTNGWVFLSCLLPLFCKTHSIYTSLAIFAYLSV